MDLRANKSIRNDAQIFLFLSFGVFTYLHMDFQTDIQLASLC